MPIVRAIFSIEADRSSMSRERPSLSTGDLVRGKADRVGHLRHCRQIRPKGKKVACDRSRRHPFVN
jgi:hypothetical protein